LRGQRVNWREPTYKVFDEPYQSVRVLNELLQHPTRDIVIDIEVGIEKDTDFDHPQRYTFLCVGIGYERGKVVVIGEQALRAESVRDALNEVLESKRVWCHNGKFDLSGLSGLGISDIPLGGDTMLQSYVLDERQGTHKLGDLAVELLGAPNWKHVLDEWVGAGKKKASYARVPRDVLYKYNAFDVSCTWDLMEYFNIELAKVPKFPKLHEDLCHISDMMQHIEQKGIRVDMAYNAQLVAEYEVLLAEQEKFLSEWVNNPRSPQQVKAALYDLYIRTDSTDALHMELIMRKVAYDSEVGQFVRAMQKYRKDQKMYGTYIKGMNQAIYRGRLHGNFLLHGTTTGRWACKKPNMLNIPRGPKIKSEFIPDEGCVFVQGDLKTAELRVVAIEADCPWLIEVLSDPTRDIHNEVSRQRYGPNFTKEQRIRAKAVVFGLSYGREAESIGIEYDVPIDEARDIVNAFFQLIPEVKAWQAQIRQRVWNGEDLVNGFGRMRRFHLVTRENKANIGREALAYIPQSTANDINMRAATTLWKQGVDVRLCVHDSVLANAKPDEAEEVAALIRKVHMETALLYSDKVPFYSDTSIGKNWGELA
jgi:DNA polymerase-1